MLHKVCGTLDHCFITTHSIHKAGDILQIYFCATFRETRHHAQAHVTSGTLICTLCPFFGREKNTEGSAVGLRKCWQNIFLRPLLVFQPVWGWSDLGSFQHPQSNSSPEGAWNLGGLYLTPHEDNSIQLLSIANNYNGLPYLVSSVWQAHFQKPYASEVWTSYRSTAKQF